MKNEISPYYRNKKPFTFKPKNTKLKKNDLDTEIKTY